MVKTHQAPKFVITNHKLTQALETIYSAEKAFCVDDQKQDADFFDAEFEDKVKSFKRAEEVFSNTRFRGILYQSKKGKVVAKPFYEEARYATDEEAMLYQAMLDLQIAS